MEPVLDLEVMSYPTSPGKENGRFLAFGPVAVLLVAFDVKFG